MIRTTSGSQSFVGLALAFAVISCAPKLGDVAEKVTAGVDGERRYFLIEDDSSYFYQEMRG